MNKYKIFKVNSSEFVLTSEEGEMNKLKGNQVGDIVNILKDYQETSDLELTKKHLIEKVSYSSEFVDMGFNWLQTNKFIDLSTKNDRQKTIIFIGEFNDNLEKVNDLKKSLSKSISTSNIIDIGSLNDSDLNLDADLIVLFGPLWYNHSKIKRIATIMKKSSKDFLYIEPYKNGITIGPLMNLDMNTLCINCLYKRKLANNFNPDLIIENMYLDTNEHLNNVNVLDIGNYTVNKSFILNEIEKTLIGNQKYLYGKALFIDYLHYQNQSFKALKVSDCGICKTNNIYNPL